jgi:formate hydrogenlyase subunit 3/multisubunit Na+/H+ antiporter MnhD subunit
MNNYGQNILNFVLAVIWIVSTMIVVGVCMSVGFFGVWQLIESSTEILRAKGCSSEAVLTLAKMAKWIGVLLGAPFFGFLGVNWLKCIIRKKHLFEKKES